MGGQQKQMLQMSLTRQFFWHFFLLCVSPADLGRVKPAGLGLAGS